jgi:hypothetical protein
MSLRWSVTESITGSSRKIEEKIQQIKDNLPDFSGCKDHLFEMENCCLLLPFRGYGMIFL